MVASRLVLILALAGCGSGGQETIEAEDRPTPQPAPIVAPAADPGPPRCEKTDPRNIIVACTTTNGLRSCRTTNLCDQP